MGHSIIRHVDFDLMTMVHRLWMQFIMDYFVWKVSQAGFDLLILAANTNHAILKNIRPDENIRLRSVFGHFQEQIKPHIELNIETWMMVKIKLHMDPPQLIIIVSFCSRPHCMCHLSDQLRNACDTTSDKKPQLQF